MLSVCLQCSGWMAGNFLFPLLAFSDGCKCGFCLGLDCEVHYLARLCYTFCILKILDPWQWIHSFLGSQKHAYMERKNKIIGQENLILCYKNRKTQITLVYLLHLIGFKRHAWHVRHSARSLSQASTWFGFEASTNVHVGFSPFSFSMVLKSSQLWQLGLVFMCAGMSLKCFLLWLFGLSSPYCFPQTRHLLLSFSWVGSKTESWDLNLASCLMQNSMDLLCTSSINSDLPGTNAARWFWAKAMVLLCN